MELIMPEGIKTLGEVIPFKTTADTIVLPKSLKTFKKEDLRRFPTITKAVFHPDCTLEEFEIYNSQKIKFVQLPKVMDTLREGSFRNCKELEKVVLPEQLNTIESDTFRDTPNLKSVMWPKSPVSVGVRAFKNSGLSELKGAIFSEVGESVFKELPLREVDITLTGPCRLFNTFEDCLDLKVCILRAKKGVLLDETFKGCRRLEVVGFTEGIEAVLLNVFEGCISLRLLGLPKNLKIFGSEVNRAEVRISKQTVNSLFFTTFAGVEKMEVSLGVMKKSHHFDDNDFWEHYLDFLNSNLPTIKESLDIMQSPKVPSYDDILQRYNYDYEYDKTTLTLTLGEGIKTLKWKENDYSTRVPYGTNCLGIARKIVFPKSLEKIEEHMFSFCNCLEKIIFPPDSALRELKSDTFSMCSSLKRVQLPENLRKIGQDCFSHCDELKEVVWPKVPFEIEERAFYSSGLEEVSGIIISKLPPEVFGYCPLKKVDITLKCESNCLLEEKSLIDLKSLETLTLRALTPVLIKELSIMNLPALKELKLLGKVLLVGNLNRRYDLQPMPLSDDGIKLSKLVISPEVKGVAEGNFDYFPDEIEVEDCGLMDLQELREFVGNKEFFENLKLLTPLELVAKLESMKSLGDYLFQLYPEQFVVKGGFNEDYDLEETTYSKRKEERL